MSTRNDIDDALIEAAQYNNLDAVRHLVQKQGANVNAVKTSSGMTVLMHASINGHVLVVQCLLATGRVNVEAVDNQDGWTALMYACVFGHLSVYRCLVETGRANVQAKCRRDGRTALHFACQGHDFAKAKWLIESGGAKLDTTDDYGRNALHFACHVSCKAELVQYLVRRWPKGSIDDVDQMHGRTALHWACRFQNLNALSCLIEEGGANAKALTTTGETALHLACKYAFGGKNPIALVRYLVEICLVDDLATDQLGRTALHVSASASCHLGVVLYLTSRYPVYDHFVRQ